MSFIRNILGGGEDKAAKRKQRALEASQQKALAVQKEREAVETKKAEEVKFAQQASQKKRLRRRAGAGTIFTSPLGITGGGTVDSKVLLGV